MDKIIKISYEITDSKVLKVTTLKQGDYKYETEKTYRGKYNDTTTQIRKVDLMKPKHKGSFRDLLEMKGFYSISIECLESERDKGEKMLSSYLNDRIEDAANLSSIFLKSGHIGT